MKIPLIFADRERGGIIQIANIKGGVGKSTLATNLASILSKKGRTLIVDLDAQGSATSALGLEPGKLKYSSFELFNRRIYHSPNAPYEAAYYKITTAMQAVRSISGTSGQQASEFSHYTNKVHSGLDLIGGNRDLYYSMDARRVKNLVHNLVRLRDVYKYIILDTPSAWNIMISKLYPLADLTLIPVTLNALSTRSLKEYLIHLKTLVRNNSGLKIRIVKNEVYGSGSSKKVGKVRTMCENREFLKTLVETVQYGNKKSRLFLPESIVFDLEIPESVAIRNSQDEGHSIPEDKKHELLISAFTSLARMVQSVLNQSSRSGLPKRGWRMQDIVTTRRLVKAAVFLAVIFWNRELLQSKIPVPYAMGQMETISQPRVKYRFSQSESVYRVAKYAISRYRAIVPSQSQVENYVREVVAYHNLRAPATQQIKSDFLIPTGSVVEFFPPSLINNPSYPIDKPAYDSFLQMVSDPFPYITGTWAERGYGGGLKHEGVDVAAAFGSKIISPVSGRAFCAVYKMAGRLVAIERDKDVLLFAHMDERLVKTGDWVEKGQVIGTVGMTGHTTGPHVHVGYGLRFPTGMPFGKHNYKLTDPMLWYYRQHYQNTIF